MVTQPHPGLMQRDRQVTQRGGFREDEPIEVGHKATHEAPAQDRRSRRCHHPGTASSAQLPPHPPSGNGFAVRDKESPGLGTIFDDTEPEHAQMHAPSGKTVVERDLFLGRITCSDSNSRRWRRYFTWMTPFFHGWGVQWYG